MNESEVIDLDGKKVALEFNRNECQLLVISNDAVDGPRTYTLGDVTSRTYAGYLAEPSTLAIAISGREFESAIPLHWQGIL